MKYSTFCVAYYVKNGYLEIFIKSQHLERYPKGIRMVLKFLRNTSLALGESGSDMQRKLLGLFPPIWLCLMIRTGRLFIEMSNRQIQKL